MSFTTLRIIYKDAVTNYHAGQTNSVLVITAGPHTDQSLGGQGLQDFIKDSVDPAKPVAVNVIDFGSDPDRDDLGIRREAVRWRLPEPGDLGIAGAGHCGHQLLELTACAAAALVNPNRSGLPQRSGARLAAA